MAKADRLARLDDRRIDLEAEYRGLLIAALERAASGSPGLFDHKSDRRTRKAIAPVVANLCELGETIDGMREKLFLPMFELHRLFIASRGPVAASAVGEPKQARLWLDRLAAESQPAAD